MNKSVVRKAILKKNVNEEISGERLFLLYAYPCLVMGGPKLHRPKGAEEKLTALLDDGKDPSHNFLGKCFPDAVDLLGKFMGTDSLGDDLWPVEIVREFWRGHKGWKNVPMCAVMHGEVMTTHMLGNMVKVRLDGGNKMITVVNRYKLAILKRDTVFFHQHIITEVELAD